MRHILSWVSVSAQAVILMVPFGLTSASIALAQEERWETLSKQVEDLVNQGNYRRPP